MSESRSITLYLARAIACVVIIVVSMAIAGGLRAMRKPPVQAEVTERPMRVDALEAVYEDVQVQIPGFGEVRSRDTVNIAPEVPGRIVEIHPRLEVGEIIPAGEVLFRIDPRNYEARAEDTAATVTQLKNTLERLHKEYEIDKRRLNTLLRNRELARDEYDRVKNLYERDQVGTQSRVDQAEMALNAANDAADQLSQVVDLFPIRIQEAQGGLASAEAMERLTTADLDRTTVRAPFDARIKRVSLEAGQYVSPGVNVLTLADDSVLEISVPLNSREARNWLEFDTRPAASTKAWFSELKRVPVEIFWTEDQGNNTWLGELHRVERFDEQTRTLTVAVRVQGADVVSRKNGHLPLVEGMFCRVNIPGKVAERVVAVPAEAIGFDRDPDGYRTAYVAVTGDDERPRLHSIKVKESHIDGAYLYIGEGVEEGDVIITTRLINPLENRLLDIELVSCEETDS